MPVQPDPTHPKFLEGDDVLKPPSETDDVQGHLRATGLPEESGEPDDFAIKNTDEGEDSGPEDVMKF